VVVWIVLSMSRTACSAADWISSTVKVLVYLQTFDAARLTVELYDF
jgi:hypothetical protein